MKIQKIISAAAAIILTFSLPHTISYAGEKKSGLEQEVWFTQFDSCINGGEPIRGVDISSIIALEKAGVTFKNEAGETEDIFKVLADHGVNYIRVRVWNEPYDSNGNGYGGGNNDVYTAGLIGKRAARYGMKLLVDIHYSDFWADPEKQTRPKYWQQHNNQVLAGEIYKWTSWVLKSVTEAGGDIGMVQVGNETNCFFCGEKDMREICKLFASGNKAVRDFDKNILIAHHFANPSTGYYPWYAEMLNECKVDYDVFATSYYPYWHGSIENMTNVMRDIGNIYSKYVMVAEVAYPYTDDNGDCFPNIIYSGSQNVEFPYPISVEGQAKCIAETFQAMANTNGHGIGVFYWEPAWIGLPDKSSEEQYKLWNSCGSGWASDFASEYDKSASSAGGSSFDSQALFDFYGNPLESLSVFEHIYPQKNPITTTTTTSSVTTTQSVTYKPFDDSLAGDINNDGVVDVFDIAAMRQHIINKKHSRHGDFNKDGEMGVADLVSLQNWIIRRK